MNIDMNQQTPKGEKMKTIKVRKSHYETLVKIAFLISDANMAENIPEFGKEMNVDPVKNRKEADNLVYIWECMR